MRVKICGIINEDELAMCVEAGADAAGFVTEYPVPVPWDLDRQKVRNLVKAAPPFINTVVVVGGNVEHILEIARFVRPNVLQLHGTETLQETKALTDAAHQIGIKVIKALRIDPATKVAFFDKTDPFEAVAALQDAGIDALLVDSKTSNMPAGTGVSLEWKFVQELRKTITLPLILAGGLTPENVREAISLIRPYGVDVITGVELERGRKSPKKVMDFVKAAREAGARLLR